MQVDFDATQKGLLRCGQAPSGVLAGVTLNAPGASAGPWASNNMALHVGDTAAAVLRNRAHLQTTLGADGVQWLEQVHGVHCLHASPESVVQTPVADAMWTRHPNIALAVMTADCLPILLWDKAGSLVGAAHAGWRGLKEGVVARLIAQMPVAPQNLGAWIGPGIGPRRYEVGAEVWQHFDQPNAGLLEVHPDTEKRFLNLAAAARLGLYAAGVSKVFSADLCTYDDQRFYSHRRSGGGPTGRMASVVMLRSPG